MQVCQTDTDAFGLLEHVEGAVHAAEHPQTKHVDLHELQGIDIVLVPFDDLPVFHRCRLDRHQIIEPIVSQHKATRMLAHVPRHADQLARKVEREP